MVRVVALRLLASIPVLLTAAAVTFVLFQVIPGDAALAALGDHATPAELAAARRDLGLDVPAPRRFAAFLTGAARGDLGRSLRTGRPVTVEVGECLPYTLLLTLTAVGAAFVAGTGLGAAVAVQRRRVVRAAFGVGVTLLLALPVFALALPLTEVLAVRQRMLPVAGAGTWRHLVLPAVVLALPSIAAVADVSRASFTAALRGDWLRTARAKGLSAHAIVWGHVWPNAAAPVLALTGVHLGSLLGGAVVVETLFAWPGLGRLAVQSILSRDLPVAQGVILVLSTGFVLANLLVDVLHRRMDPRSAT